VIDFLANLAEDFKDDKHEMCFLNSN
jgi:hypothetical protein